MKTVQSISDPHVNEFSENVFFQNIRHFFFSQGEQKDFRILCALGLFERYLPTFSHKEDHTLKIYRLKEEIAKLILYAALLP